MTRFKPGDAVFADLYPFGQGSFAEYVVRAGAGVPADPGRDVVRDGGDDAAFGDPRDPGAPAAERPDAPARRPGPDRRRVGQRRPVRRPDRQGARRRGDRDRQHRPSSTSCARSAPTTCSTTRPSTTRGPASATTGSSTRTRTTPLFRLPARAQARRHLRHARRHGRGRSSSALTARAADLARSPSRWSGLMLWWKPFGAADIAALVGADRRRQGRPGHRPTLSAQRGRRGAPLRR